MNQKPGMFVSWKEAAAALGWGVVALGIWTLVFYVFFTEF